jgi:hypothetical protein
MTSSKYKLITDLVIAGACIRPHSHAPWYLKLAMWIRPELKHSWVALWGGRVFYPTYIFDPLSDKYEDTVRHELVHVRQWRKGWFKFVALYFIFPLPVLFSGRWFIEREAYLEQIKADPFINPSWISSVLWENYLCPWPKSWMTKWFLQQRDRMLDEKWQR